MPVLQFSVTLKPTVLSNLVVPTFFKSVNQFHFEVLLFKWNLSSSTFMGYGLFSTFREMQFEIV